MWRDRGGHLRMQIEVWIHVCKKLYIKDKRTKIEDSFAEKKDMLRLIIWSICTLSS